MIVEGQVQGGIAQGIGQALIEGCTYDEELGQLLTGSYMDYNMPRARNMPQSRTSSWASPAPIARQIRWA